MIKKQDNIAATGIEKTSPSKKIGILKKETSLPADKLMVTL